jgi:hypothetical protein
VLTNRFLHRLLETRLYHYPSLRLVREVVVTNQVTIFGRFIEAGLDLNIWVQRITSCSRRVPLLVLVVSEVTLKRLDMIALLLNTGCIDLSAWCFDISAWCFQRLSHVAMPLEALLTEFGMKTVRQKQEKLGRSEYNKAEERGRRYELMWGYRIFLRRDSSSLGKR